MVLLFPAAPEGNTRGLEADAVKAHRSCDQASGSCDRTVCGKADEN